MNIRTYINIEKIRNNINSIIDLSNGSLYTFKVFIKMKLNSMPYYIYPFKEIRIITFEAFKNIYERTI